MRQDQLLGLDRGFSIQCVNEGVALSTKITHSYQGLASLTTENALVGMLLIHNCNGILGLQWWQPFCHSG